MFFIGKLLTHWIPNPQSHPPQISTFRIDFFFFFFFNISKNSREKNNLSKLAGENIPTNLYVNSKKYLSYSIFFIRRLYMHHVDLEPTTLASTHLQGKEVLDKLELIGISFNFI